MQIIGKQAKIDQSKIIEILEATPDISRGLSEFDDSVIRKYLKLKGSNAVATALGKKQWRVRDRAKKLGVIWQTK